MDTCPVNSIMTQLVEVHDMVTRAAMTSSADSEDPPEFTTFADIVGWLSRTGRRVDQIYERLHAAEYVANSARWASDQTEEAARAHRNRTSQGPRQRVTLEWILFKLRSNNFSVLHYIPEEALTAILRLETRRQPRSSGIGPAGQRQLV